MQTARRWRLAAALSGAAALIGYGWYVYRERQLDRLYASTSGPGHSSGSVEALSAVRELASYSGARSTAMLLNIALGRSDFPWPDVQQEAIQALARRQDPRISVELAALLQPHHTLETRHAAAEALRFLRCADECVASILHYLERVMAGEPNYEDRTILPAGLAEVSSTETLKAQESLYGSLFEVLKREKQTTLERLVRAYGLGTSAPARFSLAVISRMHFSEACAVLIRSAERAGKSTPELFLSPREEMRAALAALKCQ